MMGATTGRRHDVVECRKVLDEQFLRCSGFLVTSAVRHRLSAASLIKGIDDIYFQLLKKLQSGDTDFWIEKVDIAGDHQRDLHRRFLQRSTTQRVFGTRLGRHAVE